MAKDKEVEVKNPLMPVGKSGVPATTDDPYVDDAQIEASDFYIPSLKVLNGTSDECKSGKARPGNFWNPYTNQEFKAPMRGVVCFWMKTRYKRENQKSDPKTEQCMSFDMKVGTRYGECEPCPYKEWGTDRKRAPECSMSHCFILATPDGPLMLRLRKKAEKYAKQFVTQKQTSQQNWWTFAAVLDIKKETGVDDSGRPADYFVPTITWDKTDVQSPEIVAVARGYNKLIGEAQAAGTLREDPVEEEPHA